MDTAYQLKDSHNRHFPNPTEASNKKKFEASDWLNLRFDEPPPKSNYICSAHEPRGKAASTRSSDILLLRSVARLQRQKSSSGRGAKH